MYDESGPPEGWSATTLGEIGTYLNGKAFKRSEWSRTGRPIIRIQDLTGSNLNPNYFEGEIEDRYVVLPGDLLISWSATLGAYIWNGPEAVLNQHIFKVKSKINKRFHYHLVRERLAELGRSAHGSGIVHVTKGLFNDTPVYVPDDVELQQRLADLIDAVEAKQASAAFHLVSARKAMDRFVNATLASAYADALADEDGEGERPLVDLLREPLRNGLSALPVQHATPFRVLTLTATTRGFFDPTFFKYTDQKFTDDSPFWIEPGDILVQRGNTPEYVGVPALYDGSPHEFIYPDLMIKVRVRSDIDPRFMWYMLLAPQARDYLRKRATGSAGNMPKINQGILNTVPIPMPSKTRRSEMVAKIDQAFQLASRVNERVESASLQLDHFPPSVLAKAFRGELVS